MERWKRRHLVRRHADYMLEISLLLSKGSREIHSILVLFAGLVMAVLPSSGLCSPRLITGITGFDQQVIAEIAPGQPYDAFFGECPSLVHCEGMTWFVYADNSYDIYAKAFDHAGQSHSAPVLIGDGWIDHLRPAIQIDEDGFLHVLYAARPIPLRYHRSDYPLDHTGWSTYEQVGTSATYPVPFILDGKLYVIYREGDSYSASLSLAVRDLSYPMGSPGAWTVTKLVEESSVFVPMPLSAFEKDGSVCFLFNMRDALLSSPHTSVAPSIREGMSVICTGDGTGFTDLDGEDLGIPLDYTQDRHGFPEVTHHDEYVNMSLDEGVGTYETGDLRYDGSFVEITVTPASYGLTTILVGDSIGCSCLVEFTAEGEIVLSDGDLRVTVQSYEPGVKYSIKLKFQFSLSSYRPWINGRLADDPLPFTFYEIVPDDELIIDSLTVISNSDCSIDLVTGREYKLITASACFDVDGMANFFFIDRMDLHESSRWRLMHQRGEEVVEIGDPLYHKYHPSSLRVGELIYVAVAFFEGEGIFLNNEHLTMNSRIVLLGSSDLANWGEIEIAAGSGGHVHPIFKRHDDSGLVELIWARMESETSTSLMHGFPGSSTGTFPEADNDLAVYNFPNPVSSSSNVRLVLEDDCVVSAEIYDCAGRCIRRLLTKQPMTSGGHDIPWDGYDNNGRKIVPGIYFVRVHSNNFNRSIKIILLK